MWAKSSGGGAGTRRNLCLSLAATALDDSMTTLTVALTFDSPGVASALAGVNSPATGSTVVTLEAI